MNVHLLNQSIIIYYADFESQVAVRARASDFTGAPRSWYKMKCKI